MVYKVVFCACKFQKPLTWHMAINTAHQMSNPGVSKERINWNFQGDWEGGSIQKFSMGGVWIFFPILDLEWFGRLNTHGKKTWSKLFSQVKLQINVYIFWFSPIICSSFFLQMYAFPLYYASSGGKVAVIQQASKFRPRTKSPSHKMRVHHEESNEQVSQYHIMIWIHAVWYW